MKTVLLPSNLRVPALGLGTWRMGELAEKAESEIAALRYGIELGMALIDTAEMYANAEMIVAEAVKGQRDKVFIVDKVLPTNATRDGAVAACERSLKALKTDFIDLYLLHWWGMNSLAETVEAFENLKYQGKIGSWGVCNFGPDDMEELTTLFAGKDVCVNQVLYNLSHRGVEFDLFPWCRDKHIPIMAYSPVERGLLLSHPLLLEIAHELSVSPATVAIAWILQQDDVITIPKAATLQHVEENFQAVALQFSKEQQERLEATFPAPKQKTPLAML